MTKMEMLDRLDIIGLRDQLVDKAAVRNAFDTCSFVRRLPYGVSEEKMPYDVLRALLYDVMYGFEALFGCDAFDPEKYGKEDQDDQGR